MKQKQSAVQELDQYLSGELNADQIAHLERRLQDESILREELQITKQVIQGLEGLSFKSMLKRIHEQNFGNSSDGGLKEDAPD